MSRNRWLQNLNSAAAPRKRGARKRRLGTLRTAAHRLDLEILEVRTLLSLSPPIVYEPGSHPDAVVAADFNNDGKLDLATAGANSLDVSILMGNGDGTFQPARNFANNYYWQSYGRSLAVGDFNGDGKLDIEIADGYEWWGTLSVLLGNGDGTFQTARVTGTGGSATIAVAEGDFNADGKLDLAVSGFDSYPYYFPGAPPVSDVTILLSDGQGSFTPTSSFDLGGDFVPSITTGDFNRDGRLDLVWGDQNTGAIDLLLGNGDGTFAAAQSVAVDPYPAPLEAADLNGDGRLDLVTSSKVILGNGDGTFQPARDHGDGGFLMGLADINSDGKVDLVSATYQAGDSIAVYPGNGDGSFGGAQVFAAGSGPAMVAAGDFNRDGRPDLAVADDQDGVAVLLNTGNSPSLQVSGFPTSTTAGEAHTLTITALDANGSPLPSYTGKVHFTSSDPHAALPADYTFTAADHGSHSFAVTLKTSGARTISISDTSAGFGGTESGILVTAAAASTMSATGFPSTTTAGTAGSLTLTVKDAYGNIAGGYRGTVNFTSSDAKAVLPVNYTFTSSDAGVHTFSATLKTAGTQSITAADTTAGSLSGKEVGITVNPATASQLIIAVPSSATAGVAFSLTVAVADAYGNVVTGYTGTVRFKSSDNRAQLPSNYTFKPADKGVHTFAGLVLQRTGKQTITILDAFLGLSRSVIVDVLAPKKK